MIWLQLDTQSTSIIIIIETENIKVKGRKAKFLLMGRQNPPYLLTHYVIDVLIYLYIILYLLLKWYSRVKWTTFNYIIHQSFWLLFLCYYLFIITYFIPWKFPVQFIFIQFSRSVIFFTRTRAICVQTDKSLFVVSYDLFLLLIYLGRVQKILRAWNIQ